MAGVRSDSKDQFWLKHTLCSVLISALLILGTSARAQTSTVFAAASLKGALDEIVATYEEATDHRILLSFAGSSVLARQILFGAPADVFISANAKWMDYLETEGLVARSSRIEIAANRLALVTSDLTLRGDIDLGVGHFDLIEKADKIAIGLVEAVPAGQYAKQALNAFGLWAALETQLVQLDNVRSALALVSLGEARFGIVYSSDLRASDHVALVGLFPENSHTAIRYPAAVLGVHPSEAALEFLHYLQSKPAQSIFKAHGFVDLKSVTKP